MAGSKTLMDLVGKQVTAWFDGSYFKCEVVALDSDHSAGAVSEMPTHAPHNRSRGELPGLVARVGFHADEPVVSALERPGLDGAPDVSPLAQQSDEDRDRLAEAAPSAIEPPAHPARHLGEVVAVGRQAEVLVDLLAQIPRDLPLAPARAEQRQQGTHEAVVFVAGAVWIVHDTNRVPCAHQRAELCRPLPDLAL